MRILDRYILGQYLRTFFICMTALCGMYVVFDALGNFDEFTRYADRRGNLFGLMWGYYSYRAIYFFERTCSVITLAAAMFTVAWIQRHNELTAILAAGVSRVRVLIPILLAGCGLALGTVALREYVIPKYRDELSKNSKDLLGEYAQELRPRYDNQSDILMRGSQTFANEQRIHKPNFLLPSGLDTYGSQLLAEDAYYMEPESDRPGGYLFRGVSQPEGICGQPSLAMADSLVIITPRDEPEWLKDNEVFVVSDVTFEQLSGGQGWRLYSSTHDLIEGLGNKSLNFGADVRVTIHARLLQPVLDIILLFLGLPMVPARGNRNIFLAIGLCTLLIASFQVVVMGFHYLGTIYLIESSVAAWMPVILFVPVAAWLFDKLEK